MVRCIGKQHVWLIHCGDASDEKGQLIPVHPEHENITQGLSFKGFLNLSKICINLKFPVLSNLPFWSCQSYDDESIS